jgi:DNA (cytosine-5)-methyltransferase 1
MRVRQSSGHIMWYVRGVGKSKGESLTTVGLFAGIGGIEHGLELAGHRTEVLCEIDPGARKVLERHFTATIEYDIRRMRSLPDVDLIAAGFPCQDLSQAGMTAGITGKQSRLVEEVFKRLRDKRRKPRWLLLENVPFMLQLHRGKAMRYVVDQLEELGFTWAYRIVDARAFGIPQRRQRVVLLASRTEDPRPALFGCDAGEDLPSFAPERLCGFYWTEGLRGLGWAVDAVPTLKGGSTIGIPSPPAIWDPLDGSITTPDIRDSERLQGFDSDWTSPALTDSAVPRGHRWKLVGNAVSVPVAKWIGDRLSHPEGEVPGWAALKRGVAWPRAAWGAKGRVYVVDASSWPVRSAAIPLRDFLEFPRSPLSHRAAAGFLARARASQLRFQDGFLEDVARHADRMARSLATPHAFETGEHQPACA